MWCNAGAGVGRVGARQDRHARGLELAHGGLRGRVAQGWRLGGAGEGHLEQVAAGGEQVRCQPVVAQQRGAACSPGPTHQDREGRDHERLTLGYEPGEPRVRRSVGEEVDQGVGPGLDRLPRRRRISDMDDSELPVPVRRLDRRAQRGQVEGGPGHTVGVEIVVGELDPVRALGDPGVHEGLRRFGGAEGGNPYPELGTVPARRGDHRPRREEVGPIGAGARRLLLAHGAAEAGIGEHVEVRGHAEDQGLAQWRIADRVRMRVDQPREQGPARGVDDLGPLRRREVPPHPRDLAALDQEVLPLEDPLAIEDAGVTKEGGGLLRGEWGGQREEGDQREEQCGKRTVVRSRRVVGRRRVLPA